LDFVALNPTYMSPVLLPNAKPNSDQFRNRARKVTFPIRLAVFGSEAALLSAASPMALLFKNEIHVNEGRTAIHLKKWLVPLHFS
jgi:hypothetical protein